MPDKFILDIPGIPKPPPYMQCVFEIPDVSAINALANGTANPDQQKRVFSWLLNDAGAVGSPTFFPGAPDGSAFAQGRRFVGLCIAQLLSVNTSKLIERVRKRQTGD